MADIFLSYARADQARVAKLAAALEEAGYSIWWDRNIEGGRHFAKDIEREINAAKAVVVAWSPTSTESHWVLDEASIGRDAGKLVPISLDGTPSPIGYRQLQSIDFTTWPKRAEPLEKLIRAIDLQTGEPAHSIAVPAKRKRPFRLALPLLVLALLMAGGAWWFVQRGDTAGQQAPAQSVTVAVMPLQASGEGDISGNGLAGAINAALARLPGISLIGSGSTSALASQSLTVKDIGERLGAAYVIQGSFTQTGDSFTLDLELVDTASSRQVWTRRFTSARDGLAELTDDASRDLALALQTRLGLGQGQLAARKDVQPAAFEAYLEGLELLSARYDLTNRNGALAQFRRAAALDPGFAEAHAGAAYILAVSTPDNLGLDRTQLRQQFNDAYKAAIRLDPKNPLARSAQATFLSVHEARIAEAIALADAIVADNGEFGPAIYARATAHHNGGDYDLAQQDYQRAIALDPVNTVLRSTMLNAAQQSGNYEAALAMSLDTDDLEAKINAFANLLMTTANRQQVDRDYPRLLEMVREAGLHDDPQVAQIAAAHEQFLDAVLDGRDLMPAAILLRPDEPMYWAMMAYTGHAQPALDHLVTGEATGNVTDIKSLLSNNRQAMPEAVRADPRYHKIFERPEFQRILAYRKKRGHLQGFPVFPVKPYERP